MAYNRKQWLDHVVEFPNRISQTSLGNGLYNEVPAPGEIIQQGTPQNAANFNNNEEGTVAANTFADYLMITALQLQRGLNKSIGESGVIILKNTQKYPFNNSASISGNTVALKTPSNTTDYTVTIEIQNETSGAAGDVRISNKLKNGFLLSYNGSASEVAVRYNVTGRNI